MYGIIANGGSHYGKQLLSQQSINRLSKPVVRGADAVMNTGEVSEIGLGTLYRKNPWVTTISLKSLVCAIVLFSHILATFPHIFATFVLSK